MSDLHAATLKLLSIFHELACDNAVKDCLKKEKFRSFLKGDKGKSLIQPHGGDTNLAAGLDRSATEIEDSAGQRAQSDQEKTAKANAEPVWAEQRQEHARRWRDGPGGSFTPDRARQHN
ncbi:unnamed protein product [Lampetra planeri]